jgi:hypothetical protein
MRFTTGQAEHAPRGTAAPPPLLAAASEQTVLTPDKRLGEPAIVRGLAHCGSGDVSLIKTAEVPQLDHTPLPRIDGRQRFEGVVVRHEVATVPRSGPAGRYPLDAGSHGRRPGREAITLRRGWVRLPTSAVTVSIPASVSTTRTPSTTARTGCGDCADVNVLLYAFREERDAYLAALALEHNCTYITDRTSRGL